MNAAREAKEAQQSGIAPAAETRRGFPREHKREAVRLALVGDRSVRAVAQALGVRPDMLYQWKRQALARVHEQPADVFIRRGHDEEPRRRNSAAFIATHAREFRITAMCRVLQVSKAGYDAWVQRPQSARGVEDEAQLMAAA